MEEETSERWNPFFLEQNPGAVVEFSFEDGISYTTDMAPTQTSGTVPTFQWNDSITPIPQLQHATLVDATDWAVPAGYGISVAENNLDGGPETHSQDVQTTAEGPSESNTVCYGMVGTSSAPFAQEPV